MFLRPSGSARYRSLPEGLRSLLPTTSTMPKEGQPGRSTSIPVSSAAGGGMWSSSWSSKDDETLIRARAQGLDWKQIVLKHFLTKLSNSCSRRHERLMKRKNAEEGDGVKLGVLAQAYTEVREVMWRILGDHVGERWEVVEQKCMETGLKNLCEAHRFAQEKQKPFRPNDSGIGMDRKDFIYEPHGDNGIGMDHEDFIYELHGDSGIGMDHEDFIYEPHGDSGIGMDHEDFIYEPHRNSGIELGLEDFFYEPHGNTANTPEDPFQYPFYQSRLSESPNPQAPRQPQFEYGTTELDSPNAVTMCQASLASHIESSSAFCTESDISDSGSDGDDENTNGVSSVLQDARQQLVDNAMRRLIGWLATRTHTNHCGEASTSVNASGSAGNTGSTSGNSSHRTGKRKRAHGSGNDDELGQSDNEDCPSKRPRRDRSSEKSRPDSTLRLACPFFKKSPASHMRGSCSGPGWDTVHRVKAHIYRVHSVPLRCPRCQMDVHDHPGLVEHLKAVDQCELHAERTTSTKESDQPDGLSHDQIETLRKLSQRGRSQCDKWRGVYKFLFAVEDDADIPSPFYDSSTGTTSFADICQRQLPAIMEAELKRVVEEEMKAVSKRLNSCIPDLLRNAQRRLIESFNPIGRTLSPPRTRRDPHLFSSAQSDSPPCAGVSSLPEFTGLASTSSAVSTQRSIMNSTAPLTETTQLTASSSSVLGVDSGHISSSMGSDAGGPNVLEHSQYSYAEYPEATRSSQGYNGIGNFRHAFSGSSNNSHHRNQQILTPPSLPEGDLLGLDMSKYNEWINESNGEFLELPQNLNWFS